MSSQPGLGQKSSSEAKEKLGEVGAEEKVLLGVRNGGGDGGENDELLAEAQIEVEQVGESDGEKEGELRKCADRAEKRPKGLKLISMEATAIPSY